MCSSSGFPVAGSDLAHYVYAGCFIYTVLKPLQFHRAVLPNLGLHVLLQSGPAECPWVPLVLFLVYLMVQLAVTLGSMLFGLGSG